MSTLKSEQLKETLDKIQSISKSLNQELANELLSEVVNITDLFETQNSCLTIDAHGRAIGIASELPSTGNLLIIDHNCDAMVDDLVKLPNGSLGWRYEIHKHQDEIRYCNLESLPEHTGD